MTYSFDIFDTLITRKTVTPKGVFLIMQEQIQLLQKKSFAIELQNSFAYLRLKAEKDARYLSSKPEISLEDIYYRLVLMTGITENDKQSLMRLEVETEKKCCIPISQNISLLKRLLETGEQVILISDMYLSCRQIREVLRNIDAQLAELPLYVSSDYSCTKASGQLFIKVKELERISYDNWMHVGDNKHSDQYIPELLGIKTKPIDMPDYLECERQIMLQGIYSENAFVELSLGFSYYCRRTQDLKDATSIGIAVAGPIFLGYIQWLAVMCQQLNITHLNFIARDGFILKKVFDLYCNEYQLEIKTSYIYGSRKAWRVDDSAKREAVKKYIEQEIDFETESSAFVDLNGTGKSMDYLQNILDKKITVFYFNLFQKIENENIDSYSYTNIINNSGVIEALCRAPHGATIGYQIKENKWVPILDYDEKEEWEQSMFPEYMLAILKYTENILEWCKEMNVNPHFRMYVDCLLEYMETKPCKLLSEFVGNIVHSEYNEKKKYAPALQVEDIKKFLNESMSYQGSNFLYSLKRSEKSVQDYYERSKTSWPKKLDCNYDNSKINVVLYGAGKNGKRLYGEIKKIKEIKVVNWVDVAYQAYQFQNMPVESLSKLKEQKYDYVIITVKNCTDDIKTLLLEIGIEQEKIKTHGNWIDLCKEKNE